MEPLGADFVRDQTKTVSTGLHEETKPICIKAGSAILEEEISNKFKLHKLRQQESEITQKLHNLRVTNFSVKYLINKLARSLVSHNSRYCCYFLMLTTSAALWTVRSGKSIRVQAKLAPAERMSRISEV